MRRLRLMSREEQLLRETVRGLLREAPGDLFDRGALADLADASPPRNLGPKGFLGKVVYLKNSTFSGPMLIAGRKSTTSGTAEPDAGASAYLVLFDTLPDQWSISSSIFLPPVISGVTREQVEQVVTQTDGWETVGEHPERLLDADLGLMRMIYEMPKRQTDIDAAYAKVGLKRGGPGYSKIWRVFGAPAEHTVADALLTTAGIMSDVLAVTGEFAGALSSFVKHPAAVATLQGIKAGDKIWSVASIAAAGAVMTGSYIEYEGVKRTGNLSINPAIGERIEFYKDRVVGDAVMFALSTGAAAAELMTKGSVVASSIETSLLVLKTLLLAFNAKGAVGSALQYFDQNILPKLIEARDSLLRLLETAKLSIQYKTREGKAAIDLAVETLKNP